MNRVVGRQVERLTVQARAYYPRFAVQLRELFHLTFPVDVV